MGESPLGEEIEDVATVAGELVASFNALEGKLNDAEFLLLTVRREFAAWVLSRIRGLQVVLDDLGVKDEVVIELVTRYQGCPLGPCEGCRRFAPRNDHGLCAWGCSPRSPMSMAPETKP